MDLDLIRLCIFSLLLISPPPPPPLVSVHSASPFHFKMLPQVSGIFSQKFPQLENIIRSPMDYLLVVKRIAEEEKKLVEEGPGSSSSSSAGPSGPSLQAADISKIDFTDILPNQLIMTMNITVTHSKTAPLERGLLEKVGSLWRLLSVIVGWGFV